MPVLGKEIRSFKMVLFRFSWYYIFAVQIAFYFLRFEDKTCPHVTMATDFVGLVSDVMWTRKYTYFHYFCSSNQCKSIKHNNFIVVQYLAAVPTSQRT